MAFLIRMCWSRGFVCERCGHSGYARMKCRKQVQCNRCKHQTGFTAGTVFHGTKLPLTVWFLAIYHLSQSKGGISSVELGRRLGAKAMGLGVAGGILGLWLFNLAGGWLPLIGMNALHLSFDMIAMLGFLILMGTVVNNPILIVHQAMTNVRKRGMDAKHAVRHAVDARLRPIAKSTLTTLCGLSPLVFIPEASTDTEPDHTAPSSVSVPLP